MARRPRIEIPGAHWHLITRGVRRQPIFLDPRDHERFLEILAQVVDRFGWVAHAYCLMPNHYHLHVETPQPTLSDGMQRLNGRYAQYFNRRHDVEGHVFERRFRSQHVKGEAHLLELSRYIVLNPVRAGLCRAPQGWRWSSYRAAIGLVDEPRFLTVTWLLRLYGDDRRLARASFERFVHAAIAPGAAVWSDRLPAAAASGSR